MALTAVREFQAMMFSRRRSRKRQFYDFISLALVSLIGSACGGSLFNVKPVVQSPMPVESAAGGTGALQVRALPMLSDDENQEMFDANLPLSGLLPIRVELTNKSDSAIPLEKAKWILRDASGTAWKTLNAKQTASYIMAANEVTMYNPSSRDQFVAAISSHALDVKTALAPGQTRQGLVFFRTEKKTPVENPKGLVLSIEKIAEPVEVKVN